METAPRGAPRRMGAIDPVSIFENPAARRIATKCAGRSPRRKCTRAMNRSCAALVYVYDHDTRQLPRRLTETFHDHHAITVSTMHVHLDRKECMEIAVLRGPPAAVLAFGDQVIAERGVRHGRLVVVPTEADDHGH